MFIGDWMERGERYFPEALAVVDVAKGSREDQGRFTYRQMNARANRLAAHLRHSCGVGRGDRVAFLALNGVEVLDAFFACGKLGAIFVPLNWRSHARECREVIELTTPRVLLFSDELRLIAGELLGAADPAVASVTHAIHLDGAGLAGSVRYADILSAALISPIVNEQVDEEDIVCLLFTGGTTGPAKAAQISYRMIAWNTLNTLVHELARGDVTLTHTPMFHTGGLFVYTLPLLTLGGTVVIMQRWTAEAMLELIARERVTVLFCVPTQYQAMLQAPGFASAQLGSLRFLTSGGAPLPLPILAAYRAQHGVVFKQGFGMTEFGPGIFSLVPEEAERRAGSIGKPNYFIEARLVDDDGRAVAPGGVGELVLKGPSACSGYFGNPEATAQAVDAEGWFHTGDLARTDDDGFYFIVGRKKDMFISGGENVYPLEIERILYEHPAVAQCAVVGAPDERWGEVGWAFVVRRGQDGAAPNAEAVDEPALLAHCAASLAKYKVPKRVIFVGALPTSAAGKILKRELVKQLPAR